MSCLPAGSSYLNVWIGVNMHSVFCIFILHLPPIPLHSMSIRSMSSIQCVQFYTLCISPIQFCSSCISLFPTRFNRGWQRAMYCTNYVMMKIDCHWKLHLLLPNILNPLKAMNSEYCVQYAFWEFSFLSQRLNNPFEWYSASGPLQCTFHPTS